MTEPTIAASYAAALLEYAVARGITRDVLLRRADVLIVALRDPDGRVFLGQSLSLFASAIELSGDSAFALQFGEAVPMSDVSLGGLLSQSATTAESWRQRNNAYGRITLDAGEGSATQLMIFEREGNDVWLSFTTPLFVAFPWLTESTFARCVVAMRAFHASRNRGARCPYPMAVHFTHAEPTHRAEYDRIFGVPLVFGSRRNAWLVDEAFVAFRQPSSTGISTHAFQKHADRLLEQLETSQTIRGQVQHIVTPRLAKGARIDYVAAALGVSRQTLLRQLKHEGTTFRAVVDELRKAIALQALTQRRLSVKQIAADIGFSDVTAFSRAFRRWTGQSPRLFLQRQESSADVVALPSQSQARRE